MSYSHTEIVLIATLAVLSWQLWVLATCQRVCRRYLNRMAGRRSDGPRGAAAPLWFGWVDRQLQVVGAGAVVDLRQRALNELDVELETNGAYVFLQRMSPVGPLMGVLLTTLALARLASLELNLNSAGALAHLMGYSIRPIALGMAAGVVVALLHHLLFLHRAGAYVDDVRRQARVWLDERLADWTRRAAKERPRRESPEASLDALTRICRIVSEKWEGMVGAANANIERSAELSRQLEAAVEGARSAKSASDLLEAESQRSARHLADVLGRVETIVVGQSQNLIESCDRVATSLNEAIVRFNGQATQCREANETLATSCRQLATTCLEFRDCVESSTSAQRHFYADADAFRVTVGQFREPLAALSETLQITTTLLSGSGHSFDESQRRFGQTVDSFGQVVTDGLTATCREHSRVISESSQVMNLAADSSRKAAAAFDTLQDHYKQVGRDSAQLTEAVQGLASTLEMLGGMEHILRPSLERLEHTHRAADAVVQSLHVDVTPLNEAVSRFTRASTSLATMTQSLLPLATSSDQLIDALRRVEHRLLSLPGDLRAVARAKPRSLLDRVLGRAKPEPPRPRSGPPVKPR